MRAEEAVKGGCREWRLMARDARFFSDVPVGGN